MTENQRIVINWQAKLKAMGWPDDAMRDLVKELCEVGYKQCIEDIKQRNAEQEKIIAKAVVN
jgi:hypothetical protein